MNFSQRYFGFTLAETLIAVVVLGILAAITVTSLIKNYQKTQTITKLKKIYSDINQAIDVSVIENGPVDTWQGSNQEKIRDYLIPHFKVDEIITLPEARRRAKKYYEISGKQETGLNIIARTVADDRAYALNLRNGTQIWIISSSIVITFLVDLNGSKKPNTFGKDVFLMRYYIQENIFDFDSRCDTDTEYIKRSAEQLKTSNSCNKYGCNKNSRGMWCGALIEASGWQFPKDYPW